MRIVVRFVRSISIGFARRTIFIKLDFFTLTFCHAGRYIWVAWKVSVLSENSLSKPGEKENPRSLAEGSVLRSTGSSKTYRKNGHQAVG